MTDAEKAKRKLDIATSAARYKRQATYWVTRDRLVDGTLSEHVDVWLVKPVMRRVGASAYYKLDRDVTVVTSDGPTPAHFGTWSIPQCLREIHTYPDDELQMIRVGHADRAAKIIADSDLS